MNTNIFYSRQNIGLVLGLIFFSILMITPAPQGLSIEGYRVLAVAVLMATWWITEAIPIAATSLIPLVLFPVFHVADMKTVSSRYADPNIFLFMGGFMIAMAMQKWKLHRRIALLMISKVGSSPKRLIAGFMFTTAVLSMWISNTATTVMMLPIALAIVSHLDDSMDKNQSNAFALSLMLGIAYSASVGGVATLIGTPPNIIFVGQVKSLFSDFSEIGFVEWMLFALPLSIGFLILIWFYLTRKLNNGLNAASLRSSYVENELSRLGRWSRGEIGVMFVFCTIVLAWMFRADISIGDFILPGWQGLLGFSDIHDGAIAIAGALLLFVIPADLKKRDFLLDWNWASKLPWHVLLLFGGGFALAEGCKVSGLSEWIGSQLLVVGGLPIPAVIFSTCFGMTFLTEITSNTATATMLLPVLASASEVLKVHPYLLMIPATISASFAFMLPVATPPNAIVFGSGRVSIPQMAKTGFLLNVLGALWITFFILVWGKPVLGIGAN